MNGRAKPYDVTALTPVEEKVWALRQQGKKRAEIGAELNLKPVTVTRYLVTIKEKITIAEQVND